MRASRITISSSRPVGATTSRSWSGRSTEPAVSANLPSAGTFSAPREVARGEVARPAGVHDHRALLPAGQELRPGERGRVAVGVEELVPPAVQLGVVAEVLRRGRLVGGDDVQELRLAHRPAGVVGQALRADGGLPLGGQVLPARRAGAVRREHPHLVRQPHQLVLHALVQQVAKLGGGHAGRGQQVRAPDVADEQSVAGEHAIGHAVVGVLEHQDADRLRGVPGGLHDLQSHVAERDPLDVGEVPNRVLRAAREP